MPPLPSTLAGWVSKRTTCSCSNCNSAASSIVTTRSSSGILDERILSKVVLPEPVPPEMTILSRAKTQARRKLAIPSVIVLYSINCSIVSLSLRNLRMVIEGPSIATGGIIALTREPSGKRASTEGLSGSMRRPKGRIIRSIIRRT